MLKLSSLIAQPIILIGFTTVPRTTATYFVDQLVFRLLNSPLCSSHSCFSLAVWCWTGGTKRPYYSFFALETAVCHCALLRAARVNKTSIMLRGFKPKRPGRAEGDCTPFSLHKVIQVVNSKILITVC